MVGVGPVLPVDGVVTARVMRTLHPDLKKEEYYNQYSGSVIVFSGSKDPRIRNPELRIRIITDPAE
jgi:hypothetical protein